MRYSFDTSGTCTRKIEFDINDNIITNVTFYGGCPGNLAAIARVVEGKTVEEIESLFKDIKCGFKPTSCSAQLAIAVRKAYNELKKVGLDIPDVNINDDLTDEKFRICTITNQLSKGLEFDAVIINNVSEEIYNSSNSLDMKLLYVAITRALHELDIVYSGTLSKPLETLLDKKNEHQLIKQKK